MLNYPAIFQRFGIPITGALHLGGFVGTEDATYRSMGFAHRLFVEAQPDTFQILGQQLAGHGARTLRHIDTINAEICFDRLYDGTPHVRDVDTVSAHRTWGDGFYVKDPFTKHATPATR